MCSSGVSNPPPSIDLATKVNFLRQADSYPEPAHRVDVVETHMSWVFLTDKLVYKLKKPVTYSYLDFSTLEARRHFCLQSLRLNRRLADSVYLDVVALTADNAGRLTLEGPGTAVEWLEKMRRLPAALMLDQMIRREAVTEAELRRLVRVLCGFYAHAERVPISAADYRHRLHREIEDNHLALAEFRKDINTDMLSDITERQLQFVERRAALLDARVEGGHIIDAHGDLRPEHVCLSPEPVVIDCLEFSRELRTLDVVHELGYLAMECEWAGAPFIGETLFEAYRLETHDDPAQELLLFYMSHKALVRAKLALWHLHDHDRREHEQWIRRAHHYMQLAERYVHLIH